MHTDLDTLFFFVGLSEGQVLTGNPTQIAAPSPPGPTQTQPVPDVVKHVTLCLKSRRLQLHARRFRAAVGECRNICPAQPSLGVGRILCKRQTFRKRINLDLTK